jgi:glycosyltransferase involved in cell wall biosynthesis
VLIGLYEGFGIPPLESLHYKCVPVVAKTSSLPEVVGEAGILVDPNSENNIAHSLVTAVRLTHRQRAQFLKHARLQTQKFSWKDSAEKVLEMLEEVGKR